MTANDLVRGAMRLLGVVASGESIDAAEMADGISALNAMIDSWNTERLMIYTIDAPAFTLVPGKQDYTMGPGGDFDMPRPNRIEEAYIRLVVNTSMPMDVPLNIVDDEQWGDIPLKNIQGPIPYQVYNRGDYPLSTLSFFPIPSVANQFVPYVWHKLTKVTNPAAQMVFPDGYERALRYNLAIELSAEYRDCQLTPQVVQIAAEAKGNLKRLNSTPVPEMAVDPALTDETPSYASSMANLYAGGRIR